MRGSYGRKYLSAVRGLYSNRVGKDENPEGDIETIDLFDKVPAKAKGRSLRVDVPSEFEEHRVVVVWLMRQKIPFYHVPNGGYRKAEEAYKLKAMGVFSGVPDLCILGARKGFHGLYVEVKRRVGGRLSDTQRYWGDLLVREGYCFKEGKGADECIKIIRDYFDI
jgi:hypothetical protein